MKPQQKSRINAFDVLRGWCLIVISSDHLMRFPSIFDPLTGRGLLWVTAAEGFFFISGALVGIVRGRKMHNEGLKAATHLLWRRAGKLYAASVVLTLLFTGLAYWLESRGLTSVKGGLWQGNVLGLLWSTLTLQYAYGWTDFLNYYVVYLLLSPALLWLLRRGGTWLVVLGSLALWIGKWFIPDANLVAFCTWQIYFFLGLLFGYHYQSIHRSYRALSGRVRRNLHWLVYALTGVTIVASFAFTFGTPIFEGHNAALYDFFRGIKDNWIFTMLLQDNRTGLLRPLFFGLWFATLFALTRRYESAILHRLGWLLLPLGKNSLYVYIVQGVVVFSVMLMNLPLDFFLNTFIDVAAIAVYWWAVHKRLLFSIIPR